VIGEKSSIEIDGWVKVGVAGFGDSESSSDVLICHRQIMEGAVGIDGLYIQGGKIRWDMESDSSRVKTWGMQDIFRLEVD
jgi:hypothetical protein